MTHSLCIIDITSSFNPGFLTDISFAISRFELAVYGENTICVGFARLGSEDQKVVAGSMKQLLTVDFGAPLHCLVIVGKTHPVEEEMLEFYGL